MAVSKDGLQYRFVIPGTRTNTFIARRLVSTVPKADLDSGAARQIVWPPRESIASAPDEAFEFAFRPSESLLHRFALVETHTHLR